MYVFTAGQFYIVVLRVLTLRMEPNNTSSSKTDNCLKFNPMSITYECLYNSSSVVIKVCFHTCFFYCNIHVLLSHNDILGSF